MRLEYFLQGLNYPCIIEWYASEINDESCIGSKKYTFSAINDTIEHFEMVHFVAEFKKTSQLSYKIAIV